MSENQLLQSLEVAFNQVYAGVCSVPDHSEIHTYLLKTKPLTGHDLF